MPESGETSQDIKKDKAKSSLSIHELYPQLSRTEQMEAEYFLNRFLEVMNDIFEEKEHLTDSDLNTTV